MAIDLNKMLYVSDTTCSHPSSHQSSDKHPADAYYVQDTVAEIYHYDPESKMIKISYPDKPKNKFSDKELYDNQVSALKTAVEELKKEFPKTNQITIDNDIDSILVNLEGQNIKIDKSDIFALAKDIQKKETNKKKEEKLLKSNRLARIVAEDD